MPPFDLARDEVIPEDFPRARRGYDPDAVDEHLSLLWRKVDQRVVEPEPADPRPEDASRAVASIVEVAELGANEVEVASRRQVAELGEEALVKLRSEIARAERATDQLVAEAERVRASLESLGGEMSGALRAQLEGVADHLNHRVSVAVRNLVPGRATPIVERAEPAIGTDAGVVATARLVATKMALEGSSREDLDRELAERFELPDRAALIDEVRSRVGG